MNHNNKLHIIISLALLLSLMAVGVALAAASVTLNQYQVDFIEANLVGNSSTWTYAVTASGDEELAMSAWTVYIDKTCTYQITAPLPSQPGQRTFTSPTSYVLQKGASAGTDICAGAYSCQSASYSVNQRDPNSNILGVHFYNPDTALSAANLVTHIFQFTVLKTGEHRQADNPTSLTIGATAFESGVITSPACPPTAVNLVSLGASSGSARFGLLMAGAAAGLCLLFLGALAIRRLG